MGIFTSKIFIGVIAGGFTLAGAGLLFTGADTLKDASEYVKDASTRLVQFEENEAILVGKISSLRENANQEIGRLTKEKESLQLTVEQLKTELDIAKESLHSNEEVLKDLQKEYDEKTRMLAEANQLLEAAYELSKEGDKRVKELEGELDKANKAVQNHGEIVSSERSKSKHAKPLTKDELDSISTSIEGQ
jgi:chromosome segregation ATPase